MGRAAREITDTELALLNELWERPSATVQELTEALRVPELQAREEALRQQLQVCREQAQANAVLRRRDYAFPLYPEATLRPFCQRFLE